jgi:hypothetical protein
VLDKRDNRGRPQQGNLGRVGCGCSSANEGDCRWWRPFTFVVLCFEIAHNGSPPRSDVQVFAEDLGRSSHLCRGFAKCRRTNVSERCSNVVGWGRFFVRKVRLQELSSELLSLGWDPCNCMRGALDASESNL